MKAMSVEDFLSWYPEGDTRYELVAGEPRPVAPSDVGHGIAKGNLLRLLAQAPGGRAVMVNPGLRTTRCDAWYHADVAVLAGAQEPGLLEAAAPLAVFEVLSPGSEDHDRKVKLPDYRRLPGVREVVLLDAHSRYCEVHRRLEDGRWLTDLLTEPEDRLRLESCGLDVPLAALYAIATLDEEQKAAPLDRLGREV